MVTLENMDGVDISAKPMDSCDAGQLEACAIERCPSLPNKSDWSYLWAPLPIFAIALKFFRLLETDKNGYYVSAKRILVAMADGVTKLRELWTQQAH